MKDTEGETIIKAFWKIVKDSDQIPNQIWVCKGNKFFTKYMKSWLERNKIKFYSTRNEVKSVVSKRFVRIWNNKTYKYMSAMSNNVNLNKLF